MEIYSTEDQQVDAIKQFWKDYATPIVIGAVVGLAGLYGWSHYANAKVDNAELASESYQQLVTENLSADKLSAAVAKYDKEHSLPAYQAMLNLTFAKTAAEAGDFVKAEQALQKVIDTNPGADMAVVARLRLARVQAQQGELDKALATLDQVKDMAFAAKRDELKGDFLVRLDKDSEAREAYQAAINAGGLQMSPELQMKIDNLNKA